MNNCRTFTPSEQQDDYVAFIQEVSAAIYKSADLGDWSKAIETLKSKLRDVTLIPLDNSSWLLFREDLLTMISMDQYYAEINIANITDQDIKNNVIDLTNINSADILQSYATLVDFSTDTADHTTNIILNLLALDTPVNTYDKNFLVKAYGNAVQVMQRAEANATKGFVSAFLLNRGLYGQPRLITLDNLNNSVRQYLQYLFERILAYLEVVNPNKSFSFLENVFKGKDEITTGSKEIEYNNALLTLLDDYSTYFSVTEDELRTLYQTALGMENPQFQRNAALKLDAYEAWVILNNFDSMLKYLFGSAINIKNQETWFNVINGQDKYSLNNIADQMNKSWRVSEEFFLDQEISRLNQRLIESTPLVDESGRPTNNYLHFQDFVSLVSNIRDLAYNPNAANLRLSEFFNDNSIENSTKAYIRELNNEINKNQERLGTFRDLLDFLIEDPQRGFAAIIDILNSDILWKDAIAKDPRLQINTYRTLLRSVKLGITSYDSPQSMHKVINDSLPNLHVDTESYYYYITLSALSMLKNKFLQCYTDNYDRIFIRTLNDSSILEQARLLTLHFEARNNRITEIDGEMEGLVEVSYPKVLEAFENENNKYDALTFDDITSIFSTYLKSISDVRSQILKKIIPNVNYKIKFTLKQPSNLDFIFYAVVNPYTPTSEITFVNSEGLVVSDINSLLNNMTKEQFLSLIGEDSFVEKVLNINLYRNPNLFDSLMEETAYRSIDDSKLYNVAALDLITLATTLYTNYLGLKNILNSINNISLDAYENASEEIFGDIHPRYNRETGDLELLFTGPNASGHIQNAYVSLNRLAEAKAKAEGLGRSSVVKDADNASLGANTLSRLIGNVLSQIDMLCKNKDSATRNLLTVVDSGVVEGYYKIHEASIQGNVKRTTLFNEAELITSCFNFAFLDGLVPKDTLYQTLGDGHCGFLASVNSDKSYIDYMLVNLNARATGNKTYLNLIGINGNTVNSQVFDNDFLELRQLICTQFEGVYSKILANIKEDYGRLFASIQDLRLAPIFNRFVTKNQNGVFTLVDGVYENDFLPLRQALVQAYIILDGRELDNIVNKLLLDYNQTHRHNPVELCDQMHATNGVLRANKTLLDIIERFKSLDNSREFWTIKEAELFRGLILDNFEYDLDDFTSNNPKKINALLKSTQTLIPDSSLGGRLWVDSKTNKLILGYVGLNNGRNRIWYPVTTKADIVAIDSEAHRLNLLPEDNHLLDKAGNFYLSRDIILDVNPYLKSWNLLDYLFTQLHLLTSVGTHLGHPAKGARVSRNMILPEAALAEEAARYFALHKRNVSLTAAMHQFLLNLINGIPSTYNISVIQDINDTLYNILGTIDPKIKPFDGATFVHPLIVRWENYSLGAEKAGNSKKLYVHSYLERTALGLMVKTCGFGITNALVRDTTGNVLSWLLRKMMQNPWLNQRGQVQPYDITKDMKGLDLRNRYLDIYYFDPETLRFYCRHFEDMDVHEVRNDNNVVINYQYDFHDIPVRTYGIDSDGNEVPYEEAIAKGLKLVSDGTLLADQKRKDVTGIVVNSNWEAYQKIFKGLYCYDLRIRKSASDTEDNLLHYSETSLDNLLVLANNVGEILVDGPIEVLSLVWQPAKHSDIHYLVTAGAMKQGAANINSKNYYDPNNPNPLNFQIIKANQIGIQLDKEHNADEEELSIMNQVIQACSERGFSEDKAHQLYTTLFTLTNLGLREQMKAFRDFLSVKDNTEADYNEFRKTMEYIVKKAILLSGPRDGNLINNIARAMEEEIRNNPNISIKDTDFGIPYSDTGIFARLNTIVSAFINRAGIRQKLDGVLSVLNPSYLIKRIYGNHIIDYYRPEDSVVYSYNLKNRNGQIILTHRTAPRLLVELLNSLDAQDRPLELITPNLNQTLGLLARTVNIGSHYQVVDNTGTYNILVLTSKDYHDLKDQIIKGQIKSLKENYVLGRELSHYNVVFLDMEGNWYNIFDLAAGKLLLDIKPFIEEYKAQTLEINKQQVINKYRDVLIKVNEFVLHQSNTLFNNTLKTVSKMDDLVYNRNNRPSMVTLLRRALQNSLFAITKEKNTNIEYYNSLIDLYQRYQTEAKTNEAEYLAKLNKNTLNDEDKHLLLLKLNDSIENTYLPLLTQILDKYDVGRSDLIKEFVTTIVSLINEKEINLRTSIYDENYNLKKVQINKGSINVKAYEVVMPKLYKSLLGLTSDVDLKDIVDNPEFFLPQLKANLKTKTDYYTYVFKRLNGNHLYVLTRDAFEKVSTKLKKLSIKKDPDRKENSFRRVNYDNSFNMNLYYYTDDNGQFIDDEVYTDGTNEIIVTNNAEFYRDQSKYFMIDINFDNISLAEATKFINNARQSTNKTAKNWAEHINASLLNLINSQNTNYSDEARLSALKTLFDKKVLDRYLNLWSTMLANQAKAVHTSFLASLGIVAARIPALYLASFMPMQIAAFDTEDVNSAYVSTAQIWLLGSDYDVDAVSLASYSLNKDGILEHWSKYANYESLALLELSNGMPFPTGEKVELLQVTLKDNLISALRGETVNKEEMTKLKLLFTLNFFLQWNTFLNLVENALNSKDSAFYFDKNNKLRVRNGESIMRNIRYGRLLNEPVEVLQLRALRQMQDLVRVLQFYSEKGMINLDNDELTVYLNGLYQKASEALASYIPNLPNKTYKEVWNELIDIINDYNDYINQVSDEAQILMAKNSVMNGMHNIALRPENLIQAQTPIDEAYLPFTDKSNASAPAQDLATFTPGNVENKIRAIIINLVGKDCIGISAVGTKAFSAWTAYCNHLLNRGSSLEQQRIFTPSSTYIPLNRYFNPNDKTASKFRMLANIRPLDIATVLSTAVDLVRGNNLDIDAIVNISSMLTLATDNAKILGLNNLNAGRNLIGTYLYAFSMGVDFELISDLIMSPLGLVIRDLMNGNIFSGDSGMSSISQTLNYLTMGPIKLLNKYHRASQGIVQDLKHKLASPTTDFLKELADYFNNADLLDFDFIGRLAHYGLNLDVVDPKLLANKIELLESLKQPIQPVKEDENIRERLARIEYNRCLQDLKAYMEQVSTIKYKSASTMYNPNQVTTPLLTAFETLAQGADEMKSLGAILSSNNGVKTKINEELAFMRRVESLIDNRNQALHEQRLRLYYLKPVANRDAKPRSQEKVHVDFSKFMVDPNYKEQIINLYERIKHSVNIFDLIDKVPHFNGYLKAMALDYAGKKALSTKFRSLEKFGNKALELHGATLAKDINQIYSNTLNLISDKIRLKWLQAKGFSIPIEPGLYYIDDSGMLQLHRGELIYLPIDSEIGDANFKFWMERYIIPKWTKGISVRTNLKNPMLALNNFLKSLLLVITDRTPLHVHTSKYSLSINMSPRDAVERALLDNYRDSFNALLFTNETVTLAVNHSLDLTLDISLLNLLWLYNQCVNIGRPGQHNLTSIFDNFAGKSALVLDFYAFIHDMDINPLKDLEDSDIPLSELLYRTGLTKAKSNSNLNYQWTLDPRDLFFLFHSNNLRGAVGLEEELAAEEAVDELYSNDLRFSINGLVDIPKNYHWLTRGMPNKTRPQISWADTVTLLIDREGKKYGISLNVIAYTTNGEITHLELRPVNVMPISKVLYGLNSIKKLPAGKYKDTIYHVTREAAKNNKLKKYSDVEEVLKEVRSLWEIYKQEPVYGYLMKALDNISAELVSQKDVIDELSSLSYVTYSFGPGDSSSFVFNPNALLPSYYLYEGIRDENNVGLKVNKVLTQEDMPALFTMLNAQPLSYELIRTADGLVKELDLSEVSALIKIALEQKYNCL